MGPRGLSALWGACAPWLLCRHPQPRIQSVRSRTLPPGGSHLALLSASIASPAPKGTLQAWVSWGTWSPRGEAWPFSTSPGPRGAQAAALCWTLSSTLTHRHPLPAPGLGVVRGQPCLCPRSSQGHPSGWDWKKQVKKSDQEGLPSGGRSG